MLDYELLAIGYQLLLSSIPAIDWGENIIHIGGENNYYPGIILTKGRKKKRKKKMCKTYLREKKNAKSLNK